MVVMVGMIGFPFINVDISIDFIIILCLVVLVALVAGKGVNVVVELLLHAVVVIVVCIIVLIFRNCNIVYRSTRLSLSLSLSALLCSFSSFIALSIRKLYKCTSMLVVSLVCFGVPLQLFLLCRLPLCFAQRSSTQLRYCLRPLSHFPLIVI